MNGIELPRLGFWSGRRLPVILQIEAAECGLACVAMIANYWGNRTPLAVLRKQFSVSIKGSSLRSVISISQALALQTRPIKVDLPQMFALQLPCILHWNMNHFVVLKTISRKGAVIHDPSFGERRISPEELSRSFTGVALELTPASTFIKKTEVQRLSLREMMGSVVGFKRNVAQLLLLGLCLQGCSMVAPFYLQWVIDDALVAADRELLTVLSLGFLLLVSMQAAIGAVRSWITTVLSTSLNFQWLGNAFAHMMKLPLAFFEKRHVGDIVSRFNSIQLIQRSLTNQFVESIIDGVMVIGTLVVMMVYSLQLTSVAVIAVLLYFLLRSSMFNALRNATAEQILRAADQQTHFLESARGMQSVRLFGRGDMRRIGWMNILSEQFNADIRLARLSVSYQTANTFLFSSERIIVIWLAALAVLDTRFSVGMLFAFISYKDQFSQRLAALVDKIFELRMLRLHGERVADILLQEPEPAPLDARIDTSNLRLSLEVKNLSFRYSDEEPWILKNLDFIIPVGQCVAITGSSGCGKTTLVKLLLGLAEPTEGEIRVGGVALSHIGFQNYRELVGTVMQDDSLFTGSIAENISFFDPSARQHYVENCAKLAAIHEDIVAMPMGYHTMVGDRGTGLSGGQQQRLFLARALYKSPRLLVLDEATSHLDVNNEQLVNAAIKQIDMTRIIVAHRTETIAMAQRVLVLQHGRIVRDLMQSSSAALCQQAETGHP